MAQRTSVRLFFRYATPLMAVVCFGLATLLKKHPEFTERYYSSGVYPLIARLLSRISDLFSFSLNNWLIVSLPALILFLLILVLAGKLSWKSFFWRLTNLFAIIYILFHLFWGFNFHRLPLYDRIGLQKDSLKDSQYEQLFEQLATESNTKLSSIDKLSRGQMDSLVNQAFRDQSAAIQIPYFKRSLTPKKMMAEQFLSGANILGYYGLFFNEIHVSSLCEPADYPLILAHEMAHRYGIAGEQEANFFAWLICYESESPELRHCARLFLLRHLISAGYGSEYLPGNSSDEREKTKPAGLTTSLIKPFLNLVGRSPDEDEYLKMIEPAALYLLQKQQDNP